MRYEAMLGAAFVAGLLGAMSQQGVAPPTREIQAPAQMPEAAAMTALKPYVLPQAALRMAALPEEITPIKRKLKPIKVASAKPKPRPKPEVAEVAPEPSHGFFWRLFHKSPEDRVAQAD